MKKILKNLPGILTLILVSLFFIPQAFAQVEKSQCVDTSIGSPAGPAVLPEFCQTGVGVSGKVPLYRQGDPRWGSNSYNCGTTLASSACGPTSLAMVITYLTGKTVLPPETVAKTLANGWRVCNAGTSREAITGIPKMYGLNAKSIPWSEAKKFLEQGVPVIQLHHNNYFTSGGHYIVLTGVSNGKYLVNDPGPRHISEATESQVVNGLAETWVIQK